MLSFVLRPWVASCHDTAESLSDFVDGDLRGRRLTRVRRHLARCERCQALLGSLTRTVEALRALGAGEPSGANTRTVAAVLARIEKHR